MTLLVGVGERVGAFFFFVLFFFKTNPSIKLNFPVQISRLAM